MKKLMFAIAAMSAFAVVAADAAKSEKAEAEKPAAEVQQEEPSNFWGFGSYGLYSGYQLYGSLLNNEPTLQGYIEANYNLKTEENDFGFLGVGIWSNTDLTRRRSGSFGNCNTAVTGINGIGDAFNEWDFNIHWQKTFWFDDNKTVGLTYRSYVVWYYYPGKYYQHIHPGTFTTFDWDHYIEITNPYVTPYVNIVREYLFDANLFQFGVKKPFQITDEFSICPFLEFVARDHHYNWCFPTQFGATEACGGMATVKVELDATYMFTSNFGLFAKVAYCSIIDSHMRQDCDDILNSDDYGENKDFCWGGVGLTFNF